MNQLEQLKQFTRVVADTGDFQSIKAYTPIDATTNPSLILKAASSPDYRQVLERAVSEALRSPLQGDELISHALDVVAVAFGREILAIIPGRVSTEVDARLSFDTEATVLKARKLISMYEAAGIAKERVLIKIASTWEGITAAGLLEQEGIHCNLTLLFSIVQAAACAEYGITLISPFVGRILDWYKQARKVDAIPAAEDPGVVSVQNIFAYFKQYGYTTEIMGASFRNTGEIIELAGCDLLTISPDLLAQLSDTNAPLELKLTMDFAREHPLAKIPADEKTFRWLMNQDAMATEKLSQGIRTFAEDIVKLQTLIKPMLGIQ